jgi:hypothetical protein
MMTIFLETARDLDACPLLGGQLPSPAHNWSKEERK